MHHLVNRRLGLMISLIISSYVTMGSQLDNRGNVQVSWCRTWEGSSSPPYWNIDCPQSLRNAESAMRDDIRQSVTWSNRSSLIRLQGPVPHSSFLSSTMTTRFKDKKTAAAPPSLPPLTQLSLRLPVGYSGRSQVPPTTNADRDQLREEFYAAYNSLLA